MDRSLIKGIYILGQAGDIRVFIEKSLYERIPNLSTSIRFGIEGIGICHLRFDPCPKNRQLDGIEEIALA